MTVLLVCGVLSIGLDLLFNGASDNGWLDGAAILLAVVLVVSVSAVNDYQKELQFRQLSEMTKDCKVSIPFGCCLLSVVDMLKSLVAL